MSKFSFITDDKSEAWCLGIAQEMMREFGISEEEAIGRINSQFRHIREILGDHNIFYHQIEEDWAKDIYYEEDYANKSVWWIKGSNPRPKPYPRVI